MSAAADPASLQNASEFPEGCSLGRKKKKENKKKKEMGICSLWG